MQLDEENSSNSGAFKEDFREYHETLTEGDRLLRVVTDAKYLEASTETIFQ